MEEIKKKKLLSVNSQFQRDVDDEKLWVSEKMPLATSKDYGNSLFNVHMLKKKNRVILSSFLNCNEYTIFKRVIYVYNFHFVLLELFIGLSLFVLNIRIPEQ